MKGFDIMFSYEIKKEVANQLIDYIKNYSIQDMHLSDIASELYHYNDKISQCKRWLVEDICNEIYSHTNLEEGDICDEESEQIIYQYLLNEYGYRK